MNDYPKLLQRWLYILYFLYLFFNHDHRTNGGGVAHGVMINMLDCDIVVIKFELQLY